MERSKSEERQRAIYLAYLNIKMLEAFADWKENQSFLEGADRLNVVVQLAQKGGYGFKVEISEKACVEGQVASATPEAMRYIKEGENGRLILTLPDAEERQALHRRAINIKFSESHMSLDSSGGAEAYFKRADVISLEAK